MENETISTEPSINVQVDLTPRDFIRVQLLNLWNKQRGLVILGILSIMGTLFMNIRFGFHLNFFFPALIPGFVLIMYAVTFFTTAKKNSQEHGKRNYTINREKISFESETIQATHKWTTIKEIKQTGGYYLLYLGPNSLLILPLRNFDDQSSVEDFKRLLPTIKKPKLSARPLFHFMAYFIVFLFIVGLISFFNAN